MKHLSDARKKLSSKTGFFHNLFGSYSTPKEDAGELFVKAANQFKLAKAWTEAGDAYNSAGTTFESIPNLEFQAANCFADAAKMYKNSDISKAVTAYENVIRVNTDAGKFQQCARYSKELAELHEIEGNLEKALQAYKEAAGFYEGEDAKANASAMKVQVAIISAKLEQYKEAAEVFKEIAEYSLQSHLLKYRAREHMLHAGLCKFVDDYVGAQRYLEHFRDIDRTFPGSREEELLSNVITTVEEGDVDAFTSYVYEYDSITRLEEWKTSILLKIKNGIRSAEDDLT